MSTYLTWHTERVSRHILIEFFSRSGNAGISRRYYYIFRRYATLPSLSLFLFHSLSLSLSIALSGYLPFHLGEVIHLETYSVFLSPSLSLSLLSPLSSGAARRGAAGRTYLAHYTCATAVSS